MIFKYIVSLWSYQSNFQSELSSASILCICELILTKLGVCLRINLLNDNNSVHISTHVYTRVSVFLSIDSVLYAWFDSLRHNNNFSVMSGRVFLG